MHEQRIFVDTMNIHGQFGSSRQDVGGLPMPQRLNMVLFDLLALKDESFVRAAYECILGRGPDPEGLRHYLAHLRVSGSKADVLYSLARSSEARRWDRMIDLSGQSTERFVEEAYRRVLGREVDTAEKIRCVERLQQGRSRRAVIGDLRKSPEAATAPINVFRLALIRYTKGIRRARGPLGWYYTHRRLEARLEELDWLFCGNAEPRDCAISTGTSSSPQAFNDLLALHDEAFVRAAYRTLLGREADSGGLSHYRARLRAGCGKAKIIWALTQSDEGRRKASFADLGHLPDIEFIDAAFSRILGRKPGVEGRDHYLNLLRRTRRRDRVVHDLSHSEEALNSSGGQFLLALEDYLHRERSARGVLARFSATRRIERRLDEIDWILGRLGAQRASPHESQQAKPMTDRLSTRAREIHSKLVAGQAKPPVAKDVTSEFVETVAGIAAGVGPSESDIALAAAVDENEREVPRFRAAREREAAPPRYLAPPKKPPLPQRLLQGFATWVVAMATATHDKRPGGIYAKIRTIDFAHIGLGDNLMAWAGLHALLINDVPVLAAGCTMYVPADLASLASAIFSRFGLRVEGAAPHSPVKAVSPVFSPLPPETLMDWYKTYIGIDWRMSCFEALDLQKSIPRLHFGDSPRIRLRLRLSERILYRRRDWQSAEAGYIGYRLWLPVARKLGIMPLPFLAMMKRALFPLRADIAKHIEESVAPEKKTIPDTAVFPAGKSFQAFSPAVCKALREQLPAENTCFYIQSNDPWIDAYRAAGIEPMNLESIEEVFWVVKSARRVLTTDSFSSHVAQLLRDDFVLTLTRDFRENILHPGANPIILANHPPCAPCNYQKCLAGFTHCIAFDSQMFIGEIVRTMRAFPETDAPSGVSMNPEDVSALERKNTSPS